LTVSHTRPEDPSETTAAQRRIIRAAEEAFKKSGFRGVTMEAVARDAAVAKATLYAQFRNKEELFLAVCSRMAALTNRAFTEALEDPRRALDERVAGAIVSKHRLMLTLVRSSPHAEDLFSHRALLAGDIFAESDRYKLDRLEAVLCTEARLAGTAAQLARAMFYGAFGIAARTDTVRTWKTNCAPSSRPCSPGPGRRPRSAAALAARALR
jgi:AcrR family transcriptional regulator